MALFVLQQDRERTFDLDCERLRRRRRPYHDPADQRANQRDSFEFAGLAVGQSFVDLPHLGRISCGGVGEDLDHLAARLIRNGHFQIVAFRCEFIQPWPGNSRFRVTVLHHLQHPIDLANNLGKVSLSTSLRFASLLGETHALLAIGFD